MMCTTALFCLAVIAASAECASIGGGASLDRNAASFGGSLVFPRIPFLNAPPRRISPPQRSSTTARPANRINNIRDLFDIPNPRSLIPRLPSSSNPSSFAVPSIRALSPVSSPIPGVNAAMQSARNHVQAALNITTDLRTGIEQAIAQAFNSSDPAAAIGTLAQTVLNAYITAAENCPLLIVGSRVIQEGIRLAGEIAQSAANVIFGTTSTSTEATSTSTDATSTSTGATSTVADSANTVADSASTSTDSTSTAADSTSTAADSTSTAADSTSTAADSTSSSTDATSTTTAGTSTT